MTPFDPLRDFYQRREVVRLEAQARDLQLVSALRPAPRDTFVFPGQCGHGQILKAGRPVGNVEFSLNPLGDRLYIDMLEIDPEHRRTGLGLATLWHLWQQYQVPIVPIHQWGSSTHFWTAARQRFAAAGACLEKELRSSELDTAKQRWAHLVPESAVDRSIRVYWEWVAAERAAGREAGPGIR